MAAAETARLMASMDLDTRKFDKGIAKTQKNLGLLGHTVSTALGVGLERVVSSGISALSGAIGEGIQGALTLEKATAQTQAVITSTGKAAGITAQQVRDMANAQEDLTTADDKAVQQGENLLLTFTNIGSTVFPQATAAMVNLAIAMNKGDASTADFDGSAIQLGKALNDPVKGITALSRVGVSFSKQQIDQIKGNFALTKAETKHWLQLRKTNKAEAQRFLDAKKTNATIAGQKIILAELTKEFGNAGTAAGTGFAADISRANDAMDDAKTTIAQGLIPALGEVAKEVSATFKDPQVQKGLKDLGTGIGDVIKGGVAFAKTVPWDKIASALGTAAGFAKDLLNAFLGLPTWVQTAVITGWGLNKLTGGALTDIFGSLATGLIKGVLGMNAGVVNINAATVTGLGGAAPAGIPGFSPTAQGTGGVTGLLKGLPIIGVGIAAAEIANQTASAVGSAIADAFPKEGQGDVISTAIKTTVGALTGALGIPALIGGMGDVVGAIQGIIPLIGAPLPQPDSETMRGKVAEGLARDQLTAITAANTNIETLRGVTDDKLTAAATAVDNASTTISNAATSAGAAAAVASRGGASSIVGAIQANRPIIDVAVNISATTIQRTVTVTDRTGTTNPSRTSNGGGTAGNGGQ